MQKLQTVNAETLLYEPLEKPSFVVDSLIPTGLSLFCGSQKIGKSWLMLKLCLCVSQGIPLWDMTTMEGDVLYLCLEDTFCRIQDRLFRLTDEASGRLHFAVASCKLSDGLIVQLEDYLKDYPESRLIVIDTLQKVRTASKDNAYASDYGDIAVNKQGKLVAEDLWNGFDEDFQEAVQKYLSEKWNMPKKEDVVSEIIEKAVPVPDNSAQDYSDVPVYYEPFSYAKENDEVDLYRTSYRLSSECKQAIHEAIADNYDGMYLGDGAVDQVVRQYGMERVGYILANTLRYKNYDDRFSHSNKEWAEQVSTPEHNADRMTFRTDWVVDSHPAILDGFVTMFREELDAQKELEQEQPFVKQFYVVENLQAVPLKIERFGNLDDAMSQYQALPSHYMKALGVEKNPDPLPGSLDILQCKNGIDTIVEDYKTVPGWDNPYIQNHVVQPLQGALAVQDVELAYELPDAYFHIQTCDDGFDYTLYNKDFTERDGGVLETDGDKSVQEAMTELLAEFSCDAAEGKVMDAAELRVQADTVAEQQAEVLKEKLAAERPTPKETLSFYAAECLEFTFAGEFHDHLTMEEALEVYDKIPSERMNADKCIGFCIEEDGGFVGMYELVVNDKVQRENINSINYFRDDKLVQQAISDMEKLMAARQQSKEQERSNTKKSVLDALCSLKAKKQEQPAQEQDKPKKAKKKGMEL